jgi:hypothetical protein
MVSFVRSQDIESIKIGCDYCDVLLRYHPQQGAQLMEEQEAFDALEDVSMHRDIPLEIQATAKRVVDTAYQILDDEDYEEE